MKKIFLVISSWLLVVGLSAQTDTYHKTIRFQTSLDTTSVLQQDGKLFWNSTSNKLRLMYGGSKYTLATTNLLANYLTKANNLSDVTNPITALGNIGGQPLDGDLTAISALSGTNNIYYRSALNTWTSVTMGSGISFSGGTLSNSGVITESDPIVAAINGIVKSNGTTIAAATGSDINTTFGSQTANTFYAAPNGSAGNPSFRAMVAADVPTLNQNTTGSAGSVSNAVTFNDSNSGDVSGTTFNGSAARTISTNSIGAWSLNGASQTLGGNLVFAGSSSNRLTFNFTTLGANNGVTISSTATDAASNTQTALNISQSGANATSSETTHGLRVTNTKTGTSSSNVAGYFSSSGGTNNYGLIVDQGNVGIGITNPTNNLHVYNASGHVNALIKSDGPSAGHAASLSLQGSLSQAITLTAPRAGAGPSLLITTGALSNNVTLTMTTSNDPGSHTNIMNFSGPEENTAKIQLNSVDKIIFSRGSTLARFTGNGTTTGTTLLIENNAGDDALKILDNRSWELNGTAGSSGNTIIHNGTSASPTWGTLSVGGGGTGATTLTGILVGNGTSAFTTTAPSGGLEYLRRNAGNTAYEWVTLSGGGDALTANPLSQFASTTSAQFASVISDETGTGAVVLATSPLFVTPRLASSSTVGYVWTATDTSGNGSWQAGGGGGGGLTYSEIKSITLKMR
jgi:hypothetical protein